MKIIGLNKTRQFILNSASRMFKILFLTFVTSSLALSFFERNPIVESFTCNELAETVVEVTRNYFEDQHIVTVFEYLTLYPASSSFKCSKGNTFRPIDIITKVELIKARTKFERSSLSTYPTTEAFLITTDLKFVEKLLPLISLYNPRMNILTILWSPKLEDVKALLRKAFEDHKLLSFGVLIIDVIYEDEKYVSANVSIMLYNPFYGNETHRDPMFLQLNFTERRLEKLEEMKDFIKLRINNLHGYPLQMNIFEYPMIAKASYDENGKLLKYNYVDGESSRIFSKIMNFTPLFDNNSGNEGMHGYQLKNGTFVGSLGDIENNRVALTANPKLIADYNTSNSVFLQPLTMSKLQFIIRKRPTRRLLSLSNFKRFDYPSLVFIILLAALLPLCHWILSLCEEWIFDPQKRVSCFIKSFFQTFAIMNNVSVRHPKYSGTRLIIASTMFFALVTSTLFQSNIVKDLNLNRVDGKISTVQELIDEGYKVKMPSHLSLVFNGLGNDKISLMLNKTKQTSVDVGVRSYDLESILKPNEKIAFLWMDLYTSNYLDRYFDNETGENLFETVPEVAFKFYIANVVPKHSPFIERLNNVIIKYTELGLGQFLISHAYNDNQNVMIRRIKNGKNPKAQQRRLTFMDLQSIFQFFLFSILISSAIFFFEIIFFKLRIYLKSKN